MKMTVVIVVVVAVAPSPSATDVAVWVTIVWAIVRIIRIGVGRIRTHAYADSKTDSGVNLRRSEER